MPKITVIQFLIIKQPRYYTVASSKNYRKDNVNIAISLVEWDTNINKKAEKRFGLASNFFKELYDNYCNDKNYLNEINIKILVKPSVFRLPKENEYPLLMIGTGTGVVPYIAFLEEKLSNVNSVDKVFRESILFFGSKNREFDFIFKEDMEKYKELGLYSDLKTAFSRDQVNYLLKLYTHRKKSTIFKIA